MCHTLSFDYEYIYKKDFMEGDLMEIVSPSTVELIKENEDIHWKQQFNELLNV